MTLAASAAIVFGFIAVPRAAAAADDGCAQARSYEKTAASDGSSRQTAYDAAVAGLAANQRCSDPQMKLVNEAYLLSMRAPAEHDLHIGNWQRDIARANMLLAQCTNWPGLRNTPAGFNCGTQKRYNDVMAKNMSATPAPAPTARPTAAPTPAAGASGIPTPPVAQPMMPLPRPASPIPTPPH